MTCPICNDMGFLTPDVDPSDPRFGQLIVCQCRQAEIQQRRERRLRAASNLEGALLEKQFDTFEPRSDIQNQALSIARSYADDPHGWLVLTGDNGTGKTHLAAAIANHRLANSKPVLFVVVPDLLDHLRTTYHPNSTISYDQRFEQVRTHPLLILDDLGAESRTAWAGEKLFQIINHRYNARLPTVITTNVAIDDMPPRLRVRVHDPGHSVVISFAKQDPDLEPTHTSTRYASNWRSRNL